MGPTVFAAIPWDNQHKIWMRDTSQPGMLDTSVYGWPETQNEDDQGPLLAGGFGFSKVDQYPPRMYFSLGKKISYLKYPSNGIRTVISYGIESRPMYLDVRNEEEEEVIYFCNKEGFFK
jgi:hypothetical protein